MAMSRLYTGREAVDWVVLNGSGMVAGGISIETPEGQTQLHTHVIEVFQRRFELSRRDISYPRAKQVDRFPKQPGAWSLESGTVRCPMARVHPDTVHPIYRQLLCSLCVCCNQGVSSGRQPSKRHRHVEPQFHLCYE